MLDLDRLRTARDADYESGSALCRHAAAELARMRAGVSEAKRLLREDAPTLALIALEEI